MKYVIRITYKDDKTVAILVPKDKVQEYFDNLNHGQVFLNEETNVGFWTTVDQIRHIIVQEAREVEDEQGGANQPRIEIVSKGEGNPESGEGTVQGS